MPAEQAKDFLQKVRNPAFSGLFNPDMSDIHTRPLSFFHNTQLIVVDNNAIAPPLSLQFLQCEDHIAYLDGSDAPIRRFCDLGFLNLTDDTVIDYLEFHCAAVADRPNNILLLKNTENMPFFSDYYIDFHFDKNNYSEKDIVFSKNENDSGYIVQAPFVFDGKIDPATAFIAQDGTIGIQKRPGR